MFASPYPTFPQETFDEIINWLAVPFKETEQLHPWDEQGQVAERALTQCRLVCRSFHDTASNHLFRKFHIAHCDERNEKLAQEFMQLIKAPQGAILRYVQTLDLYFAESSPKRSDLSRRDACDLLSTILDKILDLHRTRNLEDQCHILRLSRLSISFRVRSNSPPHWTELTDGLRAALTAVCCQLPLERLRLSDLAHVPPWFFDHIQAETLEICNRTWLSRHAVHPTSVNLPAGPPSRTTVKALITNDPANVCISVPLTKIHLRQVPPSGDLNIISQHVATLQHLVLSCSSDYSAQTWINQVLNQSGLPQLKTITFHDNASYHFRPRNHRRRPPANLPWHYHPSGVINVLRCFGTFDDVPFFEEVVIELTLVLAVNQTQRRPHCSCDYPMCSRKHRHDLNPPCSHIQWADIDKLFHELLTRRRDTGQPCIKLRIESNLCILYDDRDISTLPSGCWKKRTGVKLAGR